MIAALRPVSVIVLFATLALLGPTPGAGAATLTVREAVPRLCHQRPLEGAPGVAVQRWRAPGEGIATVRLEGARFADWDLAVFGADGSRLGASTSFGAAEQALARVSLGQEVLVQACRRLGSDASVPLSIAFDAAPRGGGPPAQLVEVAVTDTADLRRLESTGLDVTHDIEPGRASVVVYSPAQRALLDGLGFATSTVQADMAAADAADRRREARAAPSSARVLRRGSGARHVFRVTGGKVREVGLADARLTSSRTRATRLFASFR